MFSKIAVSNFVKRGQENRPEYDSSFYDKIFRTLSRYVSLVLIRAGFSPNLVTLCSMLAGIVGGVFFCFDHRSTYIAGACLMLMFFLLDYCDGELARYLDEQTMSGNYLDYMSHFVVFGSILIGLTCGIYRHNPSIFVLLIGMIGLGGIYMRSLAYVLIWEIICIENLRKNNMLIGSNPQVNYEVAYEDTSGDSSVEQRKRSVFAKLMSIVQRPSGGDPLILCLFPIAFANYFIPRFVLGKWIFGVIDLYFLYLCSANVVIAIFLIAQNVNKRRVEQAYKDFFIEKGKKIRR
ncbi:MAG: CDP-alcohol phosphatidyltransferase family protein [bacterium]